MSEGEMMLQNTKSSIRSTIILGMYVFVLVTMPSSGKKPVPSAAPTPPNFALSLQYAQRAALAYEQDSTIQQQSGSGVRVTVSSPVSSGMKAYVEVNDAARVQW